MSYIYLEEADYGTNFEPFIADFDRLRLETFIAWDIPIHIVCISLVSTSCSLFRCTVALFLCLKFSSNQRSRRLPFHPTFPPPQKFSQSRSGPYVHYLYSRCLELKKDPDLSMNCHQQIFNCDLESLFEIQD